MLQKITVDTLAQLADVCLQMDANAYSEKLDLLSGSSIGQHVRHIIEFYECLIYQSKVGLIDYDQRVRNLALETNPSMVIEIIDHITSFLGNSEQTTDLCHRITYGNQDFNVATSLDRELIYLIEHSIHHYAIMQIAIKNNFPSVRLPENFGYAYSTIKHKATSKELHLQQVAHTHN